MSGTRPVRRIAAVLLAGSAAAAGAATLEVGPGRAYALPSQAIAAAADGDTVQIAAGRYVDCAVVRSHRVTIAGAGEATVLADKVCAGKAVLVTQGADITVRDLVLSGARTVEHNGAGIRAEGTNLSVDNVGFVDNENGILAGVNAASALVVRNSRFIGNGSCEGDCAHGIYAGKVALLRVEGSLFRETRSGHHVKSRAARTEISGCTIEDGPQGRSSYLVELPNGGALLMDNNVLHKGPRSENRGVAISIGAEGVTQPTPSLQIRRTRFTSTLPGTTTFVRNLSRTPVEISELQTAGQVRVLDGL